LRRTGKGKADVRWTVLFVALAFAAPAHAKPVYLRCTVDGATKSFDIAVDEERGTAATLGQTVPATFTMDEVSFRATVGGVLSITQSVNRKTLTFTSESYITGATSDKKYGICEIVKATENKF
jgi:hypothetical protein